MYLFHTPDVNLLHATDSLSQPLTVFFPLQADGNVADWPSPRSAGGGGGSFITLVVYVLHPRAWVARNISPLVPRHLPRDRLALVRTANALLTRGTLLSHLPRLSLMLIS